MQTPSFSPIFGDHMVLQRGVPVRVWGRAEPGGKLRVTLGRTGVSAEADRDGVWQAELPAGPHHGPHASHEPLELAVSGSGGRAACRDVRFGEVWILAGQSNIEWEASKFPDATAEAACRDLPEVRIFTVKPCRSLLPRRSVTGGWQAMTPASALGFSALGMTFAAELHLELGVPVGAISCALGDTCAEMWTSREALLASPVFRDRVPPLPERPGGEVGRYDPSCLFHGMVEPLAPLAARGVIWYQGESNGRRPHEYRDLFSRLIADWRRAFRAPEWPFHYVQLPRFRPFEAVACSGQWAELRAAQQEVLSLPGTAMVPAIDLGDPVDIHPPGKAVIARRLVESVLARVYGHPVAAGGPGVGAVRWLEDAVEITLADASGEPYLREPGGFVLRGADGPFHPALARLAGRRLRVSSPAVKRPMAIRYAWADNPPVTLFGANGWPAPPFAFTRGGTAG